MAVDATRFYPHSVTDTCSVWNVLSSKTLYDASRNANCHFACTAYVAYECLVKPRKSPSEADTILRNRLVRARESGQFREFHLTIDELEDVAVLERRRKLG